MNPAMRNLLVSDILIRFCEQIPYAFVVVWAIKTIASPVTAVQFGLLTAIEMATAVLIYLPVAAFADRLEKKPFVLATFVFFTAFPLVLMVSRSFGWLIIAFVVRGLKEFGEPTRKALIMDLSPDDGRAAMFGLYYLVRDLIVSVGAFGGAILWEIGPEVNLVTAAAFGLAGTLWFAVFGQRGHPHLIERPPAYFLAARWRIGSKYRASSALSWSIDSITYRSLCCSYSTLSWPITFSMVKS